MQRLPKAAQGSQTFCKCQAVTQVLAQQAVKPGVLICKCIFVYTRSPVSVQNPEWARGLSEGLVLPGLVLPGRAVRAEQDIFSATTYAISRSATFRTNIGSSHVC